MSTAFEEWEKAQKRLANLAYQIAAAVAAGLTPRQTDVDRFRETETLMRELETQFTEDT